MKIERIETFYVPPRWLFVRVETQSRAVGWGEASLEGYAEAVDGVFEALRDRLLGAAPGVSRTSGRSPAGAGRC